MKKVKIKRTFSIALLLLFLLCGSSWAANFGFTDNYGQWWSGGQNFSITIDWSDGLSVTAVNDVTFRGEGKVAGSLKTDSALKSYSLNASAINGNGPEMSVTDIPFPLFNSKVWANSSDDFFIAWDFDVENDVISNVTLMFYDGSQSGNCTYLGLDFSDNFTLSPLSDTSAKFSSTGVEAVCGQRCNCVPIPGAIWLFSSGLFGLVCIRRKRKI